MKRPLPPSQRGHKLTTGLHDPDAPLFVAMHEAGHAVAAVVYGNELFAKVDVRRRRLPNGTISLGFTEAPITADEVAGKGEGAIGALVQAIAGPVAEAHINPASIHAQGSAIDFARVDQLAAVALCELVPNPSGPGLIPRREDMERNREAIASLKEKAIIAAGEFYRRHVRAIVAVRDELMRVGFLSAEDARRIVAAHPPTD